MKNSSSTEKRKCWSVILFLMLFSLVFCIILNIISPRLGEEIYSPEVEIYEKDEKISWEKYPEFYSYNEKYIRKSGTYHLSGEYLEGIEIDAGDENGKVRLILENAYISNENGAGIYVRSADDVVIFSSVGSVNTVSGVQEGAIFSMSDLAFSGEGKIILSSKEGDGVDCRDSLSVRGGEIEINAKNNGMKANDSLAIFGGNVNILLSYEGLEARNVVILGGETRIFALDDGVNTSFKNASGFSPTSHKPQDAESYFIMKNGKLSIETRGDGIDANGCIYFYDGEVDMEFYGDKNDAAIDADNGIFLFGGDIVVNGNKFSTTLK